MGGVSKHLKKRAVGMRGDERREVTAARAGQEGGSSSEESGGRGEDAHGGGAGGIHTKGVIWDCEGTGRVRRGGGMTLRWAAPSGKGWRGWGACASFQPALSCEAFGPKLYLAVCRGCPLPSAPSL